MTLYLIITMIIIFQAMFRLQVFFQSKSKKLILNGLSTKEAKLECKLNLKQK